jgi:hypothetical protein
MVFYSILTYFVGPFIAMPFLLDEKTTVAAGFTIGFIISMVLWYTFGSSLMD